MKSTALGMRVGRAALAVLTITATAVGCANTGNSDDAAPSAASTSPVPEQPATTWPACEIAFPAAWQQAFADSGVATGGSTTPQAVGTAGAVVAVRDNFATRDLLLIEPNRSITPIYTVPNPDGSDIGFTTMSDVTMDDRRIVVGVSSDLGDNGSRPFVKGGEITAVNTKGNTLARIDVIDRKDNSVRTIVTEADLSSRGEALDSVALYADAVYWLTRYHDTYLMDGILRSYDLNTGAMVDVASGNVHGVRATPVGITWFARDPEVAVRNLAPLPAPLAAVPGIDEAQSTLVGDGTNYAWITGLSEGGTGIAWWTPDTGLTRITTRKLFKLGGTSFYPPPVHIEWPYVVLGPSLSGKGSAVVDTRSGAIANLDETVVDAGAGTIATQSSAPGVEPFVPLIAGLVRTDTLPPLSC